MNRSGFLIAFLCLVLASTAAFATDGVIEINQARANAGGVTTGDTAGFPVTISQSGSYRLTGNLTTASPSTTVLNVTAADVTIDLNGFTIKGPNVCSGTPTSCTHDDLGHGIDASTVPRVTVRNGTITGAGGTAVFLHSFSRAEAIHASHSHYGIFVMSTGGGSPVITDSSTFLNAAEGINSEPLGGLILNCVSSHNGGTGIRSLGGVVSGCDSSSNANKGFSVATALVTGSVARSNGSHGLSASSEVAYSNCVFTSNNGASPEVTGGVQIGQNICNGAACP